MSWAAAAAIGSAVVGGAISSRNAKKAAKASGDGADAAAQVQWDMYDQSREDLAPWRTTGESALNKLASLYGLETQSQADSDLSQADLVSLDGAIPTMNSKLYQSDPVYKRAWDQALAEHHDKYRVGYTRHSDAENIKVRLNQLLTADPEYQARLQAQPAQSQSSAKPDYSDFYNSPDYQFAYGEGMRATNAGLAARGLSGSGRAMKELTRYGQGMASHQLGNYTNRLSALAGVGQTATTNTAQLGANTANQVAASQQNAGDARASGYLGQGNAVNQGINNAFGTYALMNMMKGQS